MASGPDFQSKPACRHEAVKTVEQTHELSDEPWGAGWPNPASQGMRNLLSAIALGYTKRLYLEHLQDQEHGLVSSGDSWVWRSLSNMHSITLHFLLSLRTRRDVCAKLACLCWGDLEPRLLVESSTSYFTHVLESLTVHCIRWVQSLEVVSCKILSAFVVFHQKVALKLLCGQHFILGSPTVDLSQYLQRLRIGNPQTSGDRHNFQIRTWWLWNMGVSDNGGSNPF